MSVLLRGEAVREAMVLVGRLEPLLARGLVEALREDHRLRVLAGDLNGAGVAHGLARVLPRVLILDETAEPQQALPLAASDGRVLVLAREPRVAYGMLLLAANVTCLDAGVSEAELREAVHLTARGGCVFVSRDGERLERDDPSTPMLTEREIEVLEGLSDDKRYGAIAHDLQISVSTVNKHVQSVLRKLKAPSRRELSGLPVQWLMLGAADPDQLGRVPSIDNYDDRSLLAVTG